MTVVAGEEGAAPNSAGMYDRFAIRVQETLAGLTLRKAVGLIVATATVLAFTAALIVWTIDPAIDTFPDALWWAVSTVTTVGYGDVVPESGPGRIVAVALMLTGLGLIPVITSVVVSILVSQRTREAREAEVGRLDQIFDRLDALERRLGAGDPS
jgi:voltage-gated potassium channel